MESLVVSDLVKRFGSPGGGKLAVDNISFRVREGEIVGFLGPNGAGKTTTIAMLLGVTTPTSGTIRYFDRPFPGEREYILKRINYSSAYTKPPWRLTVEEHLRVFAMLYEVPDGDRRIDSMLDIFKVARYRRTLCGDLSAGNMARVNLCRAFINHPKLVLLDEPTSSMDPEVAVAVREYLLLVQEKYNTSILITSHNMAEVEELADRVIFINHGKIIAEGEPGELIKKTIPTTRVRLYMRDGQKRTVEYCRRHRLTIETHDRYAEIDVSETQVAHMLLDLGKLGVDFTEIAINKPTLEDYFLGETKNET